MTDITRAPHAVWAFTEHEHRDLVRGINRIHDVACEIGHQARGDLSVRLIDVLHWVDRELEPHVRWEESWLYPEVDARTGSPWATRAARFDHQQIRAAAERVRADQQQARSDVAGEWLAETRCHLFALEALVRAHVEREERYLIPLLEMTPPAA
jgi:Hemerythrin HHE cation binding domain